MADLNGTLVVDVDDLLMIIAAWGSDIGGHETIPEDLNYDYEVGVDDLLILIQLWGVCPEDAVVHAEGACCLGFFCIDSSETACHVRNGTYLGDDVECANEMCNNP